MVSDVSFPNQESKLSDLLRAAEEFRRASVEHGEEGAKERSLTHFGFLFRDSFPISLFQ